MKKIWLTLAVVFVLSGCEQPKIDTSSEESMKSSIQKVRDSLPEDKRASYDDAIKVVAFSNLNLKDLMQAGMTNNTAGIEAQMRSALAGKTGEEVITYADKIRKDRAEKEKTQALQEIAELEKNRQKYKKILHSLSHSKSRVHVFTSRKKNTDLISQLLR